MRRTVLIAAAVAIFSFALWHGGDVSLDHGLVSAQESWKQEFEDICAKTQDAMTLSVEELKALVERCDRLKPEIEKLGETERKVYLKRLQMCRDLYAFVLESKEKK